MVPGEKLAVRWLETRTPTEIALYEHLCRIAHSLIGEGFSERIIQTGSTTTDDVVWWYRERVAALKLDTWFHPTVDVQRPDPANGENSRSFASRPATEVILPGDLLHMDFGITYLGLNTDTQGLAYVLKPGETDAPGYLKKPLQPAAGHSDIALPGGPDGQPGIGRHH